MPNTAFPDFVDCTIVIGISSCEEDLSKINSDVPVGFRVYMLCPISCGICTPGMVYFLMFADNAF
jgi:hypothetical protein